MNYLNANKNGPLSTVVYLLSILSSHRIFRPIQNLISYSYKKVILKIIFTVLKKHNNDIIFISPRNSSTTSNGFNAFLSDLDYTVVIKDRFKKNKLLNTLSLIKKINQIFIFLDHPEIYTESENETLNSILNNKDYFKIQEFIYSIRKISSEQKKKY